VPNLHDPEFVEDRDVEGFRARRARIGYQLGTERLGVSLWEVGPGQAAYPYHFHLSEEEVLVVISGSAVLRSPEGSSVLGPGDVVRFEVGPKGAHQLLNEGEEPVRFLALSTHGQPDIVIYPDSGKLGAAERLPRGGGVRHFFRIEDEVDYYDGEDPGRS
jgi:uncharacterized cupin superfamily protein